MVVQFQKGGFYLYEDVPATTFLNVILDEQSQGRAFHRLIKKLGQYKWREISPEEIAKL